MASHTAFGLHIISQEELLARQKFVLSHSLDIDKNARFHKPLSDYDNGKRTLPEQVAARHQDELNRLADEYKDFFPFRDSCEFRSYRRLEEDLKRDYDDQREWLKLYSQIEAQATRFNVHKKSAFAAATATAVAGMALAAAGRAASVLYAVTTFAFVIQAYMNMLYIRHADRSKSDLKMVLEDWHLPDRLARYDRVILNRKLDYLNKTKASRIRRAKKRVLVADYRRDHPRVRF